MLPNDSGKNVFYELYQNSKEKERRLQEKKEMIIKNEEMLCTFKPDI